MVELERSDLLRTISYILSSYCDIFNSKSSFKQFAEHRHANYVLNAWTIDDKSIQLLDNNFYIFYQPQIFYELGLFLSFLIAVSSIIFIIFFYIRSIIFIKFLNAKK